jgi:hypothetical protein
LGRKKNLIKEEIMPLNIFIQLLGVFNRHATPATQVYLSDRNLVVNGLLKMKPEDAALIRQYGWTEIPKTNVWYITL